jgi:hypothetical protein
MARTVTRAQLRTRARQKANFEGATTAWPDTDVNERIDTRTSEIWDLLVEAAPPAYYASSYTISVTTGTISYSLPTDYMSLHKVFLQCGSTDRVAELQPMRARSGYWAPTVSATVTMEYTPNWTTFSGDSDTLNGVNGWDELVVCLVARDLLVKGREVTGDIDQQIAELRARIMKMRTRDRGHSRYIRDVDEEDATPWVIQAPIGPSVYRVRGSNIELYEPANGGTV